MEKRPNFVFIMTDTQTKSMIGAYGDPKMDTPNLDRLANTGVRFERAYTTCPLCTPARSGIFSGTHPSVNGAWCNNLPTYEKHPLMGTIFKHYGYRAAYTGKWHLDGSTYFGDGEAGGGFEDEWWYDGKRWGEEVGPELFGKYRKCNTPDDIREAGFTEDNIWGHRVADRAIDFLNKVGEEPFVLAVSFDEPHGPSIAPPEYWEKFSEEDIPKRPNFCASLENKPELQQMHREFRIDNDADSSYMDFMRKLLGCNSYIDGEIGRVIDEVEKLHGDNTVIIYTADHGDMLGAHGLYSKGPMMYDEICNIPMIMRVPNGPEGKVSHSLFSHTDIIPTMLDLAGIEQPECLHGVSQVPVLEDTEKSVRDKALIGYSRFAINLDSGGELYPIRCITDERYKLAINLFDTDELYDHEADPYEMKNLINDPKHAEARDRLHDAILDELDRIRDPFRSFRWGDRPWRSVRKPFYHGGVRRNPPAGFPFQPTFMDATPMWNRGFSSKNKEN